MDAPLLGPCARPEHMRQRRPDRFPVSSASAQCGPTSGGHGIDVACATPPNIEALAEGCRNACALTPFTPARTLDRWTRRRQYGAVAPLGSVTSTVRVLVVDDQLAFHDAAHAVVDATAGFEWIGGASCGEEGVERAESLRPDLVLMDIRLPGIGGIEAARQIASRGLRPIVVLVTAGLPPSDGRPGFAAEIVPKERLCGALLRRLWEDYG